MQLRDEVTLIHWWCKIFIEACDLASMTNKCLTQINAIITKIETSADGSLTEADGQTVMSQLAIDQCLAELLYIKRVIHTASMFVDAEEPLNQIEELLKKAECKNDLLVCKYFVKALLRHDEYQLGVECKTGYQQLLQAQRIDQDVLVSQHGHTKETIRIMLNKMAKFKQFMDVENFDSLTSAAMKTHIKKPEVV